MSSSYDFVPFAIAANKLSEAASQIKIEGEFKEARFRQENAENVEDKLLDELAVEIDRCGKVVAGSIRDFYNTTFRKLIRRHLATEGPSFPDDFKLLHDLSESERAQLQALLDNLRLAFRQEFKRLHFEYNQTRNDLGQVRRRIADAESLSEDAVVKADRERKAIADTEIERLGEQIGALEQTNANHGLAIVNKEKQLDELRKKLRASVQDLAKDELTEALSRRLRDYITLYKDRKKASLGKQIHKGLKMLMHKKGFVHDVQVHIIGGDIEIELYNKRGDVILKEGLSKGEQQLYATALLYGLVEESDFDFPIFIDSPMQKFDDQHAENIVRQFYPKIADQVILFPLINKELSAREYNILLPNVARSYLIVNADPDQSGFEEVEPQHLFSRYASLYHTSN